jgi:hypothetical protein
MANYKLSATVTISIYTNVEADSLEEAIAIAENRGIEQYNWSDKDQSNDIWVAEEFDGMATNIKEEQ